MQNFGSVDFQFDDGSEWWSTAEGVAKYAGEMHDAEFGKGDLEDLFKAVRSCVEEAQEDYDNEVSLIETKEAIDLGMNLTDWQVNLCEHLEDQIKDVIDYAAADAR